MFRYSSFVTVTSCIAQVSVATFAANIPVIFVTFRSRRFENDSVAKLIASLAVSDIGVGLVTSCYAGVAWSLQPGDRVPTWLLRLINTAVYTFGLCSIWHLAAVSAVKCTIIVRPFTHFTIFTDRVLRAIICTIWTLSLVVGAATNVGVTGSYFNWIDMTAHVQRRHEVFGAAFSVVAFIVPTLIVTGSYAKVFVVVRQKVRSTPTAVLGSFGSRTIFGSSVRSAKNLFVMLSSGELLKWVGGKTNMPHFTVLLLGIMAHTPPLLFFNRKPFWNSKDSVFPGAWCQGPGMAVRDVLN